MKNFLFRLLSASPTLNNIAEWARMFSFFSGETVTSSECAQNFLRVKPGQMSYFSQAMEATVVLPLSVNAIYFC